MNKEKTLAIIIIILGIVLEIYYYTYRFYSESGIIPISIIQGIALTSLLIGLFILRDRRLVWLLIIPLAAYSIFNTAAGQRQSLTMKAESQVLNINTQKIIDLENSIKRKTNRYDDIQTMVNNTVTDLETRWEWINSTTKYENEMDLIDSEIESIRLSISELRIPRIEESEVGKIYTFYSGLIGISSDWLQFWLQIIFSFFIAIMAPTGIVLYPVSRKKRSRIIDWKTYITKWVQYNWIGIRTGKSNHILSKKVFMEYARSKGDRFNDI
ncbi:hypothetical protein KAR91_87095, partial [Candidatus Pacearchaeota archaeon]|nr:hypothetical protein [Candidatus Pacearchaeota archaeon]